MTMDDTPTNPPPAHERSLLSVSFSDATRNGEGLPMYPWWAERRLYRCYWSTVWPRHVKKICHSLGLLPGTSADKETQDGDIL